MDDKAVPILSPEKREKLKNDIIEYFSTERDIDLGIIAAEEVLEFFLKMLNNEIYNLAIEDSKKIIRQGSENIIANVDTLTKF